MIGIIMCLCFERHQRRAKRTIPEVEFTSWEEGSSVPGSAADFVRFVKAVNDISNASPDGGPILVHCLLVTFCISYNVSMGPFLVYLIFNEHNILGTSTMCLRFIVLRVACARTMKVFNNLSMTL